MLFTLSSIIENACSWLDLYGELSKQNTARNPSVGKLFEEFCKCYYLLEPLVKNEYRNAWLFSEIPQDVKTRLNLGKVDHGIDLVLEGVDGTLSVVQCKFRNNQSCNISWTKDNLANLFADGDKADYFIVFTNASGLDKHSLTKKENQLKLVTLNDLLDISASTIHTIKSYLNASCITSAVMKEPREYQLNSIQAVIDGFKRHDRGQLILPCGAGKTLISLWIKERLNVRHTLVIVPSLALLRQIKNEWSSNNKHFIPYICVCSEQSIDKSPDELITHMYEISGRVSTNAHEIQTFLNNHDETIVYATYQSLEVICDAMKKTKFEFDLAICDEAHKTSGSRLSKFGLVHSNDNIKIKKRLYMTATPRVISENVKNKLNDEVVKYVYDMSNYKVFGLEFYRMSFREAIDKQILVDYKIIAIGISDDELFHAINQRRYISETETIDEIANNYALDKFMGIHGPTHAITFHSSVKKAKDFQSRHVAFCKGISVFHVNGQQSTNERNVKMKEFERSAKAVMTNARCLTEGIDVPAIDVVYFCDPKNSKVDIVQAAGRALRKADGKGKRFGYIVVPIFHRDKNSLEEITSNGPFKNLISIINALCSYDERLVDELKQIKLGRGKRNISTEHISVDSICNLITIEGFQEDLKNNLFFQCVSKVPTPFKLFKEARAFVHKLKFKNRNDWFAYCKSGDKPDDIPANPPQTYKREWSSWGDWLGTGVIANQNKIYRTFNSARDFVHQLGLKSYSEWQKYYKSGDKPDDIPANPPQTYKTEWDSWGDWLGTGVIANQKREYLPFNEAREYVRALGLKNRKEWEKYISGGLKPNNIPAFPDHVYRDKGWSTLSNWLGIQEHSSNREYWPFEKARQFVHSLGLKNTVEWQQYCKVGNKPDYIPAYPRNIYKNERVTMGDWLGTSLVANQKKKYLSFVDARMFVHGLGLKSLKEWIQFCKSGEKPEDIPQHPRAVYKFKGWTSIRAWLGIEETNFLPFNEARAFVHQLSLKSESAWRNYYRSGKKPANIPASPSTFYKNKGWKSMGDWLGTSTIAPRYRSFLPFHEARAFVHQLNLKSESDWRNYCKSGKKPNDIPAYPSESYHDKGWESMGDWLGTGSVANQNKKFLSYNEARAFVHQLGLKSWRNWRDYCKSGEKPNNIPSCPNERYQNKGWESMSDWLGN